MKKVLFVFLSIAIVLASIGGTASAAQGENKASAIISPLFVNISVTTCHLSINSSGNASMSAYICAVSGTDSVKISAYLQRYNSGWSTVNHWTNTYSGTYGSWSANYYVSSGYQYRLLVYFYAYDGESVESTSLTSYDYY